MNDSAEVEWIPRKRRRAPADKIEVYLPSLRHASIVMDPAIFKCVACSELLPRDFVTLSCPTIAYHSVCGACARSCTSNDQIKCPLCRSYTEDASHRHPIVLECLTVLPRPARCGISCTGWDGEASHTDTCVACYKLYVNELTEELCAVRATNRNLMNKNSRMQEDLDAFGDTETEDDE